ncbi:MAG: 5'-methylthioadenosine/adenosylhomocysteine nucleosidase [Termitinemataceae bacterium]
MIGIIGAMDPEVALLQSSMTELQQHRIGPFEFASGRLHDRAVVVLRCGIGKVQAAIGATLLIDHYKPKAVINTGSAGGINPNLRVGDVVVSSGLVYHDVDVCAFGYEPGQIPGQPSIFQADFALQELAEKAIFTLQGSGQLPEQLHYIRGVIGSGDIFMHDLVKIEQIRKQFPFVTAVEMEGAAIAHTCTLFNVPFLVIRALSDIAGTESPMKFEEFLPIAARHSSEIVKALIDML